MGPVTAALGLACAPCLAFAQAGVLEEVIVTATKQSASLQSIPVTVNAFTDDIIQEALESEPGHWQSRPALDSVPVVRQAMPALATGTNGTAQSYPQRLGDVLNLRNKAGKVIDFTR